MNILVIGSGGRENAFTWKLKQSYKTTQVFITPGNAGTSDFGTNIPIDPTDFNELKKFCVENAIQLVVVGPEQPLVEGIVDFFKNDTVLSDILIVGPDKMGSQLEGSKAFAKDFMKKYGIPTAQSFQVKTDNLEKGMAFLRNMKAPYVLKADGLASGKGVLILDTIEDAETELNAMLGGKFGEASATVIIEEFLSGIEVSVFALTDGKNYKILPEAKDYKRISEGDKGPNTGGMGAVSPVPFANNDFMQKVEERIIRPTLSGLEQESINYKGFIFFGLMNVDGNPFVIEYNVRMGDPETECIFPRIKTDFVDLMTACATATLENIKLEIDNRTAVTVMLVSAGYPGNYPKGKIIEGLNSVGDCILFHSGTSIDIENDKIKTSGGRVIAVTALGTSIEAAREKVYENIKKITFDGMNFRNDIGLDLLALNS